MEDADDGFSAHALNRCFDRYGFVPSIEEALACLQAIQTGRARLFGKGRGDAQHYRANLSGVLVNLVYSHSQQRVLTLLPPDDLRFVLREVPATAHPSRREQRAFYRRHRNHTP